MFSLAEVPRTLHVEFRTSKPVESRDIICPFHLFLFSKELDSDGLLRVPTLSLDGLSPRTNFNDPLSWVTSSYIRFLHYLLVHFGDGRSFSLHFFLSPFSLARTLVGMWVLWFLQGPQSQFLVLSFPYCNFLDFNNIKHLKIFY